MEPHKIAGYDRQEVLKAIELIDALVKNELAHSLTVIRRNFGDDLHDEEAQQHMSKVFDACVSVSNAILIKACLSNLRQSCF